MKKAVEVMLIMLTSITASTSIGLFIGLAIETTLIIILLVTCLLLIISHLSEGRG